MPSCGFNDPVVWVNTNTKVYHMKGDPYYGNTKHGQYECKSAADASGNHLSKQKGEGATAPGAMAPAMTAAPVPSPMAGGSSKHHHKKPSASPSPGARRLRVRSIIITMRRAARKRVRLPRRRSAYRVA
jgi:hypothetical protein